MGGTLGEPAEIGKMQAALRSWLHRATGGGAHGLRGVPVPALLSVLCASALSPLIAAMAGIVTGATFAGSNILSSLGSGVLSGIITDTLKQARSKDSPRAWSQADGPMGLDSLSGKVAAEIDRVLTAGDANADALRGELASLLAVVDEDGMILRALEEQSEQVRADVLAAIAGLGSDFAVIQAKLDDQRAGMRTLIECSRRESDDIGGIRKDIGGIRKDVAAIARGEPGTPLPGGSARRRHRLITVTTLIAAVTIAGFAAVVVLLGGSPSGRAAAGGPARASLIGVGCEPRISSVSPVAAEQARHIIIKGTCFGTGGPIAGDSDDFELMDLDQPWTACSQDQDDQMTCDITKWTPTSIILEEIGGSYGSDGQVLNTDDRVIVSVRNRQGGGAPGSCVVIVGQPGTTRCQPGCTPRIDSVSPFSTAQTQRVIIKGSCFGVFTGISAGFTDGNVPFFVIIDNSGGRWAGCGIKGNGTGVGVSCSVSHWSPTSITFNGFSGLYGKNGWVLHNGDHLLIKVHNVRDDGSPGTCDVVAGDPRATACHGDGSREALPPAAPALARRA